MGNFFLNLLKKKKIDRLPLVVSGSEIEQLLGVPKLAIGSGESIADAAVVNLAKQWRITERTKCKCFDTTNSNTGHHNGARVLIEQKLDKRFLHMACRHHVHEVVLEAIGTICIKSSTGLEIGLFKRFQDSWKMIDQKRFKTPQDLEVNKNKIIHFATDRKFSLCF